jgi:hypothetical protein
MANQHIEFSRTATRLSGELGNVIRQLQNACDNVQNLKAILDQIAQGPDFPALGVALNVTAAEAETIYNLLVAANGRLDNAAITTFLARLG